MNVAAFKAISSWNLEKLPLDMIPMTHFTNDPNTAHIILKSGQIRLTKIDCMRNDSEEGRYVLSLFKEALNLLYDENKISKHNHELLLQHKYDLDSYLILNKNKNGTYIPVRCRCTPYVICFSRNSSSQYMWNTYGSEDGVALNFWITEQKLSELTDTFPNTIPFVHAYRVEYDKVKIVNVLKKYIIKLIEACDSDEELVHFVCYILNECHIYVKKADYTEEHEVRLVFLKPDHGKLNRTASEYLCKKYLCNEDGKEQWKECDPSDNRYVWMNARTIMCGAIIGKTCMFTKEEIELIAKKFNPNFCVYMRD